MSFTDEKGVFHPTPCPTKAELLREEIAQRNNAATLADINKRLEEAVFPEYRTRSNPNNSHGYFDDEVFSVFVKERIREIRGRKKDVRDNAESE
ncbi:hypothetical protein ACNPG5_00580 [Citrobacter cronae]|uniref:hypothetical protein n=1 Tax=Citrobacter TaxID=544 RepID=UPI00136B8F48|nr:MULTISPECIES: hypothetical protein [Citrobacter]MYL96057.1 hypothetical protein [Citrobacter werkmanii]UBX42929.1 hypothetical protein LD024_13180 [Citrobacter werkmanii]